MNLSVCTISFRHQLISLEQIVSWAKQKSFKGIELWGVHAKNLQDFPKYTADWLQSQGLYVSMISDYLPLAGDEAVATKKMHDLCRLAVFWKAKKIRTFAGDRASFTLSASERSAWLTRLNTLCSIAQEYGVYVVVETHPNTLADTLESTTALIKEVNHEFLKINFDVIHVWEARDNPSQAFNELAPHIVHMHLKNISDRCMLDIFQPGNVYSPAGKRTGMVGVFSGEFDFAAFLHFVMQQKKVNWRELDVSLEWFGNETMTTLNRDKDIIHDMQNAYSICRDKVAHANVLAV